MAVHVYPIFTPGDHDNDPVPTGKWTVVEEYGGRLGDFDYGDAIDRANAAARKSGVCVHIHAAFGFIADNAS